MNATFLLTLTTLCLLSSGCTLSDNLLRTTVVQPIQYCNYWDKVLERHRFRKIAKLELERARTTACAVSDNYSCSPFSIDHERGFEQGFIDYLMYGGTGNPPPLPPRRYWWSDCEKLDGSNAIQDWFNGFQHGVAVAQATGYRNCVTVPLGDALIKGTLPFYMGQFSETEQAEPLPAPDGIEPTDLRVGVLNASMPPAVTSPAASGVAALPFAPAEQSVTIGTISPSGLRQFGAPALALNPAWSKSTKPSPVIRDLPPPPPSASFPSPQIAPMKRISPQ